MRIPHELQDEFPEEAPFIKRLTEKPIISSGESRHGTKNRNVYRIESEEEPATDEVLERLKKRRLRLKDEIAAMLARLERRM
jgi:uncharacterized protein YdcH (DUF465 family)